MILALVFVAAAALLVWLLLEFADRAFGEMTISPRVDEGLGLASAPVIPAAGVPIGPVAAPAPVMAPALVAARAAASGEEPASGQTVVLEGDDVEAWVRERLYGGRLPVR